MNKIANFNHQFKIINTQAKKPFDEKDTSFVNKCTLVYSTKFKNTMHNLASTFLLSQNCDKNPGKDNRETYFNLSSYCAELQIFM